jgi:hypothetical protein
MCRVEAYKNTCARDFQNGCPAGLECKQMFSVFRASSYTCQKMKCLTDKNDCPAGEECRYSYRMKRKTCMEARELPEESEEDSDEDWMDNYSEDYLI